MLDAAVTHSQLSSVPWPLPLSAGTVHGWTPAPALPARPGAAHPRTAQLRGAGRGGWACPSSAPPRAPAQAQQRRRPPGPTHVPGSSRPEERAGMRQTAGRTTAMEGSSSPMRILLGGCWQWKLSSGMQRRSATSTAGCVVCGSR